MEQLEHLGDSLSLRDAKRALWAIRGVKEERLRYYIVRRLLDKFTKLDIVPTHFHYPEVYQL